MSAWAADDDVEINKVNNIYYDGDGNRIVMEGATLNLGPAGAVYHDGVVSASWRSGNSSVIRISGASNGLYCTAVAVGTGVCTVTGHHGFRLRAGRSDLGLQDDGKPP